MLKRNVGDLFVSGVGEVDLCKEELRQAQERLFVLENIMNNVPSMIGYWDRNLMNRFSNSAYQEYFNRSREEIEGLHMKEVLGDVLYEKNLPFVQGALSGQTQTFERDIPLPNGGIRNTQAQYIPNVRDGKVDGFYVLVFDVTPLKVAAREKEKVDQQLSESYKMAALGEMAGGVAHEINTPLAVIALNIGMLGTYLESDHIDTGKCKKIVGNIERTVSRISKIVMGLLLFSKDRHGEPFKRTQLQTILEDTIPFCSEKFRNHGVALNYPHVVGGAIECRPVEISQVLVNLLNNAFDAVDSQEGQDQHKDKWVSIEIHESEAFVEIAVMDNGPGIPAELQETIMMPFFSTKEVGKGTGLGLSISKSICETHGGTLSLDRRSTHTRFVMKLPKKHETT